MTFAKKILIWYAENKRNLPWRGTIDPYNIWLSEIIMQQTRVVQGTPYYLKFVKNFPNVQDLAAASEEQVLKLWQGLGYYSRARNLHETAKRVVSEYNGKFPETYKELLKLKGIGDYTASAISSICFNAPEPVVDGNVYRVLSRYFGVAIPINSTEGISYFKDLAHKVMSVDQVRDYNQGIMEFGALQCTPKNPDCIRCPLNNSCAALKNNSIGSLPVKLHKAKIKKRFFNYVVPVIEEKNGTKSTVLQKRLGKGIWQNMYQFPLVESESQIQVSEVKKRLLEVFKTIDNPTIFAYNEKVIVHKLSHQHLYTTFWILETTTTFDEMIPVSEIKDYAVPVLISDFIEKAKILYF